MPLHQPTVEEVDDLEYDDNELYDGEEDQEYEDDNAAEPMNSTRRTRVERATQQTQSMQQFLATKTTAEITEKCRNVLKYMNSEALDLTAFLYYISWTIPEAIKDGTIKFARTALMCSEELPRILENWYRPPREHGRGIRTHGAQQAMDRWATDLVKRRMNREMQNIRDLFLSTSERSHRGRSPICRYG
jgi:hypothetical protein